MRGAALLVLLLTACAGQSAITRRSTAATRMLEVLGEADPEAITHLGLRGFESKTHNPARTAAADAKALDDAAAHFAKLIAEEPDREARIDFEILKGTAQRLAERVRLHDRLLVDLPDLSRIVYQGLQPGLTPGVGDVLRAGAAARLKVYAGPSFVADAIASVRKDLGEGKLPPWSGQVKARLAAARQLDAESVKLAKQAELPEADALALQLSAWEQFLESELSLASRDDFRPPREVYALELRDQGIEQEPDALAADAHAAFEATYAEWRALATELGGEPAAVLARLKEKQLTGEPLLQALTKANLELESVIHREKLLTLPKRPLVIRFSTPAEAAMNPVPTIDVRGFVGGQREIAVLVPPAPPPGMTSAYDDFSFEAAAVPLAAHEGRPGHELQFTHAGERGLSVTRTLFAFNTVNIEGWGLYAEKLMRPFMSKEARFVSLQFLLVRQARAFLEPELVLGTIGEQQVRDVLGKQLGCSRALVEQELRRYQFESRGQAPAYFVGLKKLEQLRARAEGALGASFSPLKFHDAVLDQGFVPVALLADGVLADLTGD